MCVPLMNILLGFIAGQKEMNKPVLFIPKIERVK